MDWDGGHLKVINPATNAIHAAANDFAGIQALKGKAGLKFLTDFRAEGGNANLPATTDTIAFNYLKKVLGHSITGTQAGKIYNNGWTTHTEIQITNAGKIQAQVGGVFSDRVDPVEVPKANAQFV